MEWRGLLRARCPSCSSGLLPSTPRSSRSSTANLGVISSGLLAAVSWVSTTRWISPSTAFAGPRTRRPSSWSALPVWWCQAFPRAPNYQAHDDLRSMSLRQPISTCIIRSIPTTGDLLRFAIRHSFSRLRYTLHRSGVESFGCHRLALNVPFASSAFLSLVHLGICCVGVCPCLIGVALSVLVFHHGSSSCRHVVHVCVPSSSARCSGGADIPMCNLDIMLPAKTRKYIMFKHIVSHGSFLIVTSKYTVRT